MKIVQTLWMAPGTQSRSYAHGKAGKAMGWRNSFYNAVSWTLSCLLWKEWYGNIHLFTDSPGKALLADTLQLPYDSVSVVLDDLPYAPELWIMGKVKVYGLQNEPFFHVDGDTFPLKPLPAALEVSPLVAQHREIVTFYNELFNSLKDQLVYVPEVFRNIIPRLGEGSAYNNGLLGGTDYAFFKRYADEVEMFIGKNEAYIPPAQLGDFNVLCEQAMYFAMAENENQNVNCLLGTEPMPAPEQIWKLRKRIRQDGYLHPVAAYKQHPLVCTFIANMLRNRYPQYYYYLVEMASELKF